MLKLENLRPDAYIWGIQPDIHKTIITEKWPSSDTDHTG
jgi:hypothetical protein